MTHGMICVRVQYPSVRISWQCNLSQVRMVLHAWLPMLSWTSRFFTRVSKQKRRCQTCCVNWNMPPQGEWLFLTQWPERPGPAPSDNRASTYHPAGAAQVLAAGPDSWVHPASRKAKLWVNLLDLQTETGLTDAAVQHVALVCGPRCATPQDQRPALC